MAVLLNTLDPMRRALLAAAVLASFSFAWAGVIDSSDGQTGVSLVAEARADGDIRVGAELMAIGAVSLDEAKLVRGSKVSISGKTVASGKVFLDVALADGHVVKSVPMAEIRKNFRVVRD